MDRYAKHLAIAGALRNAECDLELVTTLKFNGGTTQEITNTRRALCKGAARKRASTVLSFVDLDLAALDELFPFEVLTVADWPGIFADHVGLRVVQGVGTVRRIPLFWIATGGGTWTFAGPKVLSAPGTLLAVYRGTEAGKGAVVDPSEYTASTATAPSGYTVNTALFTKEQKDFRGQDYVLEADYLLPGSRSPSDEIARLLGLYGRTTDATFTAAAAVDVSAGFQIDAAYGGKGKSGRAIITDLCKAARAWLCPSGASGSWALIQDAPQASSAQFDTSPDKLQLDEYGDGELKKKVTLFYRPKAALEEDWAPPLSRDAGGRTGELEMHNAYISDHGVADRLVCYWANRLKTLKVAKGRVHAAQIAPGAMITITDNVIYVGTKDFLAPGISRPADSNEVTLREYDSNVYVYTAGTLPADATNVYTPDYSFTPPAAPTGLAIVSQGVSADTDGKVTAFALVRAVPPAVNWATLQAQLTDTTTGEIYQAQLLLNAGNYEARISGLRPNRVHSILCWAVNANNLDGATATIANFTTSNAVTALGVPTLVVSQIHSKEINVAFSQVADVAGQPHFRRYVLFEQVGGGSFTEVKRTADRDVKRPVTHGTAYTYKARSEDENGNESADSSTSGITPNANFDDSFALAQGFSGASIANGSINRGRSNTSTGSASGSLSNNTFGTETTDDYAYQAGVFCTTSFQNLKLASASGSSSQVGNVGLFNDSGTTVNYEVRWRTLNA